MVPNQWRPGARIQPLVRFGVAIGEAQVSRAVVVAGGVSDEFVGGGIGGRMGQGGVEGHREDQKEARSQCCPRARREKQSSAPVRDSGCPPASSSHGPRQSERHGGIEVRASDGDAEHDVHREAADAGIPSPPKVRVLLSEGQRQRPARRLGASGLLSRIQAVRAVGSAGRRAGGAIVQAMIPRTHDSQSAWAASPRFSGTASW